MAANIRDLKKGGVLILDTDQFNDKNLTRVGYKTNPVEDGSLSAFNKSFRHIAGMSPSDFRRDIRLVTTVPAGAFRN